MIMAAVDNNKKSGNTNTNSTGNTDKTNSSTPANTSGADATAFQAQVQELTNVSLEATKRSVQLRTLTTNLQTIKKAADERVS
ncbi:nodulation protein NopA [Mesorhizobium sp.]|uniref:nodulation protein NopA n=2 Tax=Mesorhizobium TaxID=68287 RepID=UPI00257E9401|nr:nodulation protein NopA [Mesorhizobium sp.]